MTGIAASYDPQKRRSGEYPEVTFPPAISQDFPTTEDTEDTKNFSRTKTNQHIHHIHHSHSAADLHQSKSLWYTKVTLFIEF